VLLGLVQSRDALTLGVGVGALGAIGWVDDTRSLPPGARLTIHIAVAAWTAIMLGGLPAIRVGGATLVLGPTGYVLAILGIVWSINLFNFMDGIDGLAASQAVLIFSAVGVLLFSRGEYSLATMAAIAAAAAGGFLVWNWPPAKIFLGDVGSGPLGYMIAALALASENRQSVPLLAVAIVYGVFITDASVTLIRRFRRGARLTEAHRDHAYQRLTRHWGSHKPVTGWIAVVTLVLAAFAAISMRNERLLPVALLATALLLTLLLLAVERRAPM
jgi:Fuc2NAc and GlcNAc transferase